MAWISRKKPLAQYSPRIETSPSGKELYAATERFYLAHPGYFKLQGFYDTEGVHLPPELLPMSARVISSHKTLPDIINLHGMGVSERVKLSIESLEPDVHQFKEVRVSYKDGRPAEQRFFALQVGQVAENQIVFDHTTLGSEVTSIRRQVDDPRKGDDGKICIDRRRTRGWHMWYSHDIYRSLTLSDDLKHAWDAIGVKCEEYIELSEVDLESVSA